MALIKTSLKAALLGACIFSSSVNAEEVLKLDVCMNDNGLDIKRGDKPLATYVFRDETITRPYFTDVFAGEAKLTRNHPPVEGKDATDHATYHPGIWLSFGDISGHDYWRLKAKTEHIEFIEEPHVNGGECRFAVRNRYLSADGKQTVCEEVARYRFIALDKTESRILLVWDSVFSSQDGEFHFGDQEEMGLGLRVTTPIVVDSKQGGHILNSHGQKNGREVWGKTAAWCDYGGTNDGRTIGLTLLPHPENFRPSWFHARDYGLLLANPFGRKAFGAGPPSKVVVKPGEGLRLRFGVLLYNVPENQPIDYNVLLDQYVKLAADSSDK